MTLSVEKYQTGGYLQEIIDVGVKLRLIAPSEKRDARDRFLVQDCV